VCSRAQSSIPTILRWTGCTPPNKGLRYPADPPTVEEIILVMREAGRVRGAPRRRGTDSEQEHHRSRACRPRTGQRVPASPPHGQNVGSFRSRRQHSADTRPEPLPHQANERGVRRVRARSDCCSVATGGSRITGAASGDRKQQAASRSRQVLANQAWFQSLDLPGEPLHPRCARSAHFGNVGRERCSHAEREAVRAAD
jgi:hypothetical protein